MVPFWPAGFSNVRSETLAYGLKNDHKAYLAIFAPKTNKVSVDLSALGFAGELRTKVIYPAAADCHYQLEDGILKVELPQERCARLFCIEKEKA